jgi:4-amino-4-deoxy-L-arabinose transferase-like glycosyltransferase
MERKTVPPRFFSTVEGPCATIPGVPMWQWLDRINLADRSTRIGLLCALLVATAVLYTSALGRSPPHLNHDEAGNAVNSYAISQTGRDEYGRFMPTFFIHHDHQDGQTPLEIYLQAAFFTVLPLSSANLRLPNAFVAVLSVLLMYWFMRTAFKREDLAFLAALCLATTPAHFLISRVADGPTLLFPVMLASLTFLSRWFEGHQRRSAFLVGLFLGIGFYADNSSKITVPLFFLVTVVAMLSQPAARRQHGWLGVTLSAAGLFCALTPFFIYFFQHPRMWDGVATHIQGYGERSQSITSGLMNLLSAPKLQQTFSTYLNHLNPIFLFATGDVSQTISTGRVGVFLFPCLVLIPVGLYLFGRQLRAPNHPGPISLVLLAMTVLAPVAGSVVGEHFRIVRATALLPLGSIFSAFCLAHLARLRTPAARKVLVAVAGVLILQFGFFIQDYFTDYRARAYPWFMFNSADVFEPAVDQSAADKPVVAYIDQSYQFAPFYWRFYAQKRGRPELMRRIRPFDPAKVDLASLPSGTLMIWRASQEAKQQVDAAGLTVTNLSIEPDGKVSLFLVRKN